MDNSKTARSFEYLFSTSTQCHVPLVHKGLGSVWLLSGFMRIDSLRRAVIAPCFKNFQDRNPGTLLTRERDAPRGQERGRGWRGVEGKLVRGQYSGLSKRTLSTPGRIFLAPALQRRLVAHDEDHSSSADKLDV
jgi:hypothetical protein